ncbi:MAG: DUF2892 domain-containing protein [Bacteroidota bacterium]
MKASTKKTCADACPIDSFVRGLAGFMILLSLMLTYTVSPYWLFLTLFVGLNLFQSSFSKWCLAESIFCRFCLRFVR